MEHELKANLLALLDAYKAGGGAYTEGTIGRYAAADSRFFERCRSAGGSFTVRKYDEVVAWFATNWPAGIPFPPGGFPPSSPQPAAGVASPDAAGGLSVSGEVAE